MKIGNISVDITGNLQPLADSMQQAQSVASTGAAAISSSFNQAAGAANVMVQASASIAESAKAAAQAEQQAGDAAASSAGKILQLSDAAQTVVDRQMKLTDSADRARAVLMELQAAYERGAASAADVARAESDLERAMKRAGETIEDTTKSVVQATESATGLGGALSGLAEHAGSIAGLGATLTAALTVPIAGAAAAALSAANNFDEAFDHIRAATGKTGGELESLKSSFTNVFTSVPATMEDVSSAMATLSQRLHLTGEDLEALATQELNLAHITGSEVRPLVEQTTRIFGDWGMSSKQAGESLDFLFKASQATATSITELTAVAVQFGAPMRELGFTFEQTVALMAKWQAEGVNVTTVLAGLRQAVGNFANAGLNASDALRQVISDIKNTEDHTKAMTEAVAVFGKRAATDMVDVIRNGHLDFDALVASIKATGDTINQAAEDTKSFGEKWQLFKNQVQAAIEPLGVPLTNAFQKLFDAAKPVLEVVKEFAEFAAGLPTPVLAAGVAIAGLAAVIGPAVAALAGIGFAIQGLEAGLPAVAAVGTAFSGLAAAAIPAAVAAVESLAAGLAELITVTLPAAIAEVGAFSQALLVGAGASIAEFATVTVPAAGAAILAFATTAIPAAIASIETFITVSIPAAISALATFATSGIASAGAALTSFATTAVASVTSALSSLATSAIPIAVGALSTLGVAVAAAAAGFAGFKLGEWLYENSSLVRSFGDSIANLINKFHDWIAQNSILNSVLAAMGDPVAKANQAMAAAAESASRLASKLAEHGVIIQRGTMSMEEYVNALMKAVDGLGKHASAADVDAAKETGRKVAIDAANQALKESENRLASVVQAYNNGAASANDVAKAQEAVAQAQAKVASASRGVIDIMGALGKANKDAATDAEKAAAQQEKAFESLDKSSSVLLGQVKDSYSDYLATLDSGGKSAASLLSSIASEIAKAEAALPNMTGVAREELMRLIENLKSAQAAMQEFADQDAMAKVAAKVADLAAKYPQQISELTGANKQFVDSMLDMASKAAPTFKSVADAQFDAVDRAIKAQKQLDDATEKMRDSLLRLPSASVAVQHGLEGIADSEADLSGVTGQTKKNFEDLLVAGMGLSPALSAAWTGTVQFSAALKVLNIDADGVSAKLDAQRVAFEKVAESGQANAVILDAAWGRLVATVRASEGSFRSVDDLLASKLFKDMQDGIQKARDLGESWGDIAAKEKDALQEIINIGVATGQNVGTAVFALEKLKIAQQEVAQSAMQMSQGQIIALANMNEAAQGHRDMVNLLGDTYKLALGQINNAFDKMGQKMVENLFTGQNLFKGLGQEAIKLAETITQQLVGKALRALGETLIGLVSGGTSDLAKLMGGVQGASQAALEAAKVAQSQAISAAIASGQAATSGAAAATSTAAAATSMAASGAGMAAASALMAIETWTMVGAIAAIVGAIAGIASFVTSLETNHKLAVIEENTRKSAILAQQSKDDAWSQFNSMYDRVGEILNAIFDVTANVVHVMEGEANVFDRLGDLWKTLVSIDQGIGALASGGFPAVGGGSESGGGEAGTGTGTGSGAGGSAGGDSGSSGSGGAGGTGTGGGSSIRGGAYVASSLSVQADLTLIAQSIQGLAQIQSDTASAIKDMAAQDAKLAEAIRALAGMPPTADPALVSAVANQTVAMQANAGVVGAAMDSVAAGTVAMSAGMAELAAGQHTAVDATTQMAAQQSAATTQMAAQQSAGNMALESISLSATQGTVASLAIADHAAQIATAADATQKGIFDTVSYMGIAAATAAATQSTAETTSGTATDILSTTQDIFSATKLGEETSRSILDITTKLGITAIAAGSTMADMSGQLSELLKVALYQAADLDFLVKASTGAAEASKSVTPAASDPLKPHALDIGVIAGALGAIAAALGQANPNPPSSATSSVLPPLGSGRSSMMMELPSSLLAPPILPTHPAATLATQVAGSSSTALASTAATVSVSSGDNHFTFNAYGVQDVRGFFEAARRELRVWSPEFKRAALGKL